MQFACAAAARDCLIKHRPALHLLHILAEVADRHLLRHRDFALVRRLVAHHHAEQRGLAGAVRTHQPNLFTGVQLKRRFDEDKLPAVLLIDVGKRNHPKFQASRVE